MDYLTVAEMADLKNCKGRMKYMIPVSALSEDIQAKYYAKIKKDAGLAPEVIEDKPEKPVKSKKQSRRFEELSADERIKLSLWCELLQEWQSRRLQYKSKTEFDKNFVGECRLKYAETT